MNPNSINFETPITFERGLASLNDVLSVSFFKELNGVLGDLVEKLVSLLCCKVLRVHPGWAFASATGTTILSLDS